MNTTRKFCARDERAVPCHEQFSACDQKASPIFRFIQDEIQENENSVRMLPKGVNILVTGTPGTGKTTLCQMVHDQYGLNHIEVGSLVKEHKFYCEYDEEFGSYMIDEDSEDRLLDYMEPLMVKGNNIVDHHSCALFPLRWFHYVVVLRADTEPIFDRLTARGYSESKRADNMEAEISGVVLEEAAESYDSSIICVRPSNTLEEMLETVEIIGTMIQGTWVQTAPIERGGGEVEGEDLDEENNNAAVDDDDDGAQ